MASLEVEEEKRELRQQGAIEAAEEAPDDPRAAEAAEKVLVEETQKAGMPAYQFDPDASPEEKAAIAEAVSTVPSLVADELADLVFPCAADTSRVPSRQETEGHGDYHGQGTYLIVQLLWL